jgi:hypothetical protein
MIDIRGAKERFLRDSQRLNTVANDGIMALKYFQHISRMESHWTNHNG